MSASLASKLKNELYARYSLVPSSHWLEHFLATTHNTSHPLAALTSTANFRLLSTDFTESLSNERGQVFPSTVSDVNIKEVVLTADTPVQVLDIQDISTSKWSQIEAIERVERGEEIRGREVIRNVPGSNDEDATSGEQERPRTNQPSSSTVPQTGNSRKGSSGPHKILLQDSAGTKVWAFELSRIDRITIVNSNPPTPGSDAVPSSSQIEGMQIGCKMLLKKGTKVRRTLLMLSPANVTVIGGKVEIWDKKWREGRKARLMHELERDNDNTSE